MQSAIDFLVVGTGITGSVLARELHGAGYSVRTVDAGLARPRALEIPARVWCRKWGPTEALRYSFAWYDTRGWVLSQGAQVGSWRKEGWASSHDYAEVDACAPLLEPDVHGDAVWLSPDPAVRVNGETLRAKRLVLATGNESNPLLPVGADRFTMRWAHWTLTRDVGSEMADERLHVYEVSPHHILLAKLSPSGELAVGALMRNTEAASVQSAWRLAEVAEHLGLAAKRPHWQVVGSQRCIYPDGVDSFSFRPLGDNVWMAAGLGSVGYCLAPWLAKRFIEEEL